MTKNKIQRILIAVRPRERGLPLAASHACSLAQGLGAEIGLMSCVVESRLASGLAWADPVAVTDPQLESFDRGRHQQVQLEELAKPLRDAGVTVTTLVSTQRPIYQSILSEAANWQADLLVVGVHEPRLIARTHLTDIDRQLMRLCPCPLLIVRNPNVERYRAILAAVDPLHRHAEPAGLDDAVLRAAAEFSRAFNARLCVTNVYADPNNFEVVSSVEVQPGVFYGTENIEAAHHKAVADLIDEYGIGDAETLLRTGEPAAVIAALASEQKIDLVVLGAVKRSRLEAAILGSTAEAVVADARCDVLLVKPSANS
jgi:universal stress protein E